ncbi:MAG: ABC transporter ATP-binding protein [Chlamydiia bacterium]
MGAQPLYWWEPKAQFQAQQTHRERGLFSAQCGRERCVKLMNRDHPLLVVERLVKEFKGTSQPFRAVDDVSLQVFPGECLGLLGPNGAGKTTTIRCICGQIEPSAGEIQLHGISMLRDPRKARMHLGVVPQHDAIENEFTVIEQLSNYGLYFGMRSRDIATRAKDLLERFSLADRAQAHPESLSGGMKRRLMFARALLTDPSVLILDEPTSGLDPHARQVLWGEIAAAKKDGRGILLTTHYMGEAERLCDRVALINHGRIVDLGTPQELIRRHVRDPLVQEELRPGIWWERPANLEDVFFKITGSQIYKEDAGE